MIRLAQSVLFGQNNICSTQFTYTSNRGFNSSCGSPVVETKRARNNENSVIVNAQVDGTNFSPDVKDDEQIMLYVRKSGNAINNLVNRAFGIPLQKRGDIWVGYKTFTASDASTTLESGNYTAVFGPFRDGYEPYKETGPAVTLGFTDHSNCDVSFRITDIMEEGEEGKFDEEATVEIAPLDAVDVTGFDFCSQVADDLEAQCCECFTGSSNCQTVSDSAGIWTGVGCIKTDPETMVTQLITLGLRIGGGAALLMIIFAGFMFSTSAGDTKKLRMLRTTSLLQ